MSTGQINNGIAFLTEFTLPIVSGVLVGTKPLLFVLSVSQKLPNAVC
jgi:hypothetical protein